MVAMRKHMSFGEATALSWPHLRPLGSEAVYGETWKCVAASNTLVGSSGMKKILIVDDQLEIRDLVEVTLQSGDYQVFQGASGEEAIFIAKREKPDLIIMDVMMPGAIDGLEATRIIKSHPDTQACTVVMLSGQSLDEDRQKGISAGADDYFIKPFSPLQLIKKVQEVFA